MVETMRSIIVGENKSWVLFKNGTCVVLVKPEADLAQQAIAIMKEWGPVYAGTPAGDFSVVHLDAYPGWVVTYQHPDILNYVSPDEVSSGAEDVTIGLLGRSKRDLDGESLTVVHVEDKRETR